VRCVPEGPPLDLSPIGSVSWRQRVRVRGRVRSLRVQPWSGIQTVECVLIDETGGLSVVFLGRRSLPGISLGRIMEVEGMLGQHRGYLAMVNPHYELVAATS